MNSAKMLAKKIRDLKIKDKDFLTCSALASYLRSMLSVPCRAISRRLPTCELIWNTEADAPLAYTDDIKIVINPGHPLVKRWCKTRVATVRLMIGVMVHEFGHYRFTDSAGHQTAISRVRGGKFFPKLPTSLPDELADNLESFEVFFEENPALRATIARQWHDIYNILEDAYIEECLYRTLSGQLIDCLDYVRRAMRNTAPTLSEMLGKVGEGRANMLPVVRSLLLSYAKYGTVRCDYRNPEEARSEPMLWLKKCRTYADAILTESSTRKRLTGVNMVFLTLWPLIREFLDGIDVVEMTEEELRKRMRKFSGAMDSGDTGSPSGAPVPVDKDEDTGASGSSAARKRTIMAIKKAAEDSEAPDADGVGGHKRSSKEDDGDDDTPCAGAGSDGPDEEEEETGISDRDDDPDSHTDETAAPPALSEGEVDSFDGDGYIEREEAEESADVRELAEALARIEREVREAAAIDEVNSELTRELGAEAAGMDYGAAHRGLHVTVSRIEKVSEGTKATYKSYASGIEAIADTMVKKILPLIKKKSAYETMPMTGFFSGSKFDASRLVYGDYRYFKQGATPAPDTRLALSVLVDESGSMRSGINTPNGHVTRISAAKMAALALYLFCEKSGIKCSVLGHTSQYGVGDLRLSAYADFETPDRDDRYRILSITAKEDNRDGAALLFAGEHLLKRPEPTKLLVSISDGAPLATGYRGVAAENDMANIVNELRRKGVSVFAAAIGSDKENIHRIYGGGYIDITNLTALPDQLLQLVKRYIR